MLGVAYAVHVLVERQFSPGLKKGLENAWDAAASLLMRLRILAQGLRASAPAKITPVTRDSHAD
jgi:hypothetical protein